MRSPIRVFSLVGEPELTTDGLLSQETEARLREWDRLYPREKKEELILTRMTGRYDNPSIEIHRAAALARSRRIIETPDECILRMWLGSSIVRSIVNRLGARHRVFMNTEAIRLHLVNIGQEVPSPFHRKSTIRDVPEMADVLLMEEM